MKKEDKKVNQIPEKVILVAVIMFAFAAYITLRIILQQSPLINFISAVILILLGVFLLRLNNVARIITLIVACLGIILAIKELTKKIWMQGDANIYYLIIELIIFAIISFILMNKKIREFF